MSILSMDEELEEKKTTMESYKIHVCFFEITELFHHIRNCVDKK